jgi:predicted nucleotidyltransferase
MMKIKELPEKFESAVAEITSLLLSHYKDTRRIIVIGSVADGTYNKTSDIDLVWIKSRPLDYKKQRNYAFKKAKVINNIYHNSALSQEKTHLF